MKSEEFFEAIKKNDIAKVRELVNEDPRLLSTTDKNGNSPIVIATYYNQPEIATLFISEEAIKLDVFECAMTGELNALKDLVAKDRTLTSSFSNNGFTPLHLTAFFGQVEAAKYLIETGANVEVPAKNAMKVTPLHSAVAGDQVEIAKLLISNGANVNARQEGGFTPLHAAAQDGSVKMATLLLGHGAKKGCED